MKVSPSPLLYVAAFLHVVLGFLYLVFHVHACGVFLEASSADFHALDALGEPFQPGRALMHLGGGEDLHRSFYDGLSGVIFGLNLALAWVLAVVARSCREHPRLALTLLIGPTGISMSLVTGSLFDAPLLITLVSLGSAVLVVFAFGLLVGERRRDRLEGSS